MTLDITRISLQLQRQGIHRNRNISNRISYLSHITYTRQYSSFYIFVLHVKVSHISYLHYLLRTIPHTFLPFPFEHTTLIVPTRPLVKYDSCRHNILKSSVVHISAGVSELYPSRLKRHLVAPIGQVEFKSITGIKLRFCGIKLDLKLLYLCIYGICLSIT